MYRYFTRIITIYKEHLVFKLVFKFFKIFTKIFFSAHQYNICYQKCEDRMLTVIGDDTLQNLCSDMLSNWLNICIMYTLHIILCRHSLW